MLKLEIIEGTKTVSSQTSFSSGQLMIGRSNKAHLPIDEPHLSHEHGVILFDGHAYIYRDLGSTNGSAHRRDNKTSQIDGVALKEVNLQDGDHLLLGNPESPVVLLCHIQPIDDAPNTDATQRVLATRRVDDVHQVVEKIQSDTQLSKLFNGLKALGRRTELSEVHKAICHSVFSLIPKASHCTILLHDHETNQFVPVSAQTVDSDDSSETFVMSRAVLNKVLKERSAVLTANASQEFGATESIMAAKIQSSIGVPLWSNETILGIIQCDNRGQASMLEERDLELLLVLAEQASLAIERAQLIAQLRGAERKLKEENQFFKQRESEQSHSVVIGKSGAISAVLEQLDRVANTHVAVSITGETGTGKELFASAVHYRSSRKEKMFVPQNCAALPESLLESELFGHKKGAFTGADRDKKGLFELADGGTLFLDEIGEMPLSLQAKLLRVLQENEIRPLGSQTTKKIDVRLVCATNRDLQKEIQEGRFREDLFYRINVFPIQLPPLRDRRDDIPALVHHFVERFTADIRKPVGGISHDVIKLLKQYSWPGNIRELQNEVQRFVIQVNEGAIVDASHLSAHIRDAKVSAKASRSQASQAGLTLKDQMEAFEKEILIEALEAHGQNKTKTAASLGITREGLHKKINKHSI